VCGSAAARELHIQDTIVIGASGCFGGMPALPGMLAFKLRS
jgi:hypothetical protein